MMKIDGQPFFSEAKMEHLARECALVERKSPITGFKFLLTFTTGLLNTPNGTLAQLTAFLSSVCQIEVSPQALDERMSIASRCVHAMLSRKGSRDGETAA